MVHTFNFKREHTTNLISVCQFSSLLNFALVGPVVTSRSCCVVSSWKKLCTIH